MNHKHKTMCKSPRNDLQSQARRCALLACLLFRVDESQAAAQCAVPHHARCSTAALKCSLSACRHAVLACMPEMLHEPGEGVIELGCIVKPADVLCLPSGHFTRQAAWVISV